MPSHAQALDSIPVRVSSFPLYDTFQTTAGTTVSAQVIRLFQNGLGAAADGFTRKSKAQTNLERSGGMASGQAYRIESIGVQIYSSQTTPTSEDGAQQAFDTLQLARGVVLEYESGALVRTFGPIGGFPAGFGVEFSGPSVGATAANNSGVALNGANGAQGRYQLREPIILRDNASFSWNLNIPDAISLHGSPFSSPQYQIQVWLWGAQFQEVVG